MSIPYLPARLVKGFRWYILYYQTNPATGKRERFRETFDLNRIHDLEKRYEMAIQQLRIIDSKLPLGYPFQNEISKTPSRENIVTAIQIGTKILCKSERKRTRQTAVSMSNIFNDFLEIEDLKDMKIGEFRKIHARKFLDYGLFEREIANRTYNNYVERMKTLFYELKERDYVIENPFVGFKKKKVKGKKRRAFSEEERDIMAKVISKSDNWLYLGVLLQYHCFIRPIELRRLRFYMIDLNEGIIKMPGDTTKNWEDAIITIPDSLISILEDFNFKKYNQRFLVFGKKMTPHPNIPCSHDNLNSRHKAILKDLFSKGRLNDIDGLSFYSWKDTGAYALFKAKVNTLEIMRQLSVYGERLNMKMSVLWSTKTGQKWHKE
ncbi:MAG: hypothetical protein P1U70_23060 [Saprospiraceae bacterium]|jgi:integrase|nr:hypothetical protein [Saprospiraceae bacterium]